MEVIIASECPITAKVSQVVDGMKMTETVDLARDDALTFVMADQFEVEVAETCIIVSDSLAQRVS